MSDVRLSNASPTVERVDPRPQDSARPRTRRALFGRPDPDSTQSFLANSIGDDVQNFREKYNFDPVTDRPLSPGNYEWEEERDAPEFYRRNVHLRGKTMQSERGAAPEGRRRSVKRPREDSDHCSSDVRKSHPDRSDDDGSPPGAAGCSALAVADEPSNSAEEPCQS